jgi:hypothetical protein
MKLPTNKALSSMSPQQFATWVKQGVNRREFKILIEGITKVCSQEFSELVALGEQPLPVLTIQNTYLYALGQIYPDIAPLMRQAIDNNILNENHQAYDVISLVYVASVSDMPCTTMFCTKPRDFVMKNQKNPKFWQWFRAHLPHHIKLAAFTDYGYPIEFVLPSMIISSPHDLQFYKVFCREVKDRAPDMYEALKIDSQICQRMLERLKLKESGITPPPQAVTLQEVNNNFLVLDLLR